MAAHDYQARCLIGALDQVPTTDAIGAVTADELEDVYELRMARRSSPGRAVYDRLLAAPEHGRCPLCGQRDVATLDHHLPKTAYSALVVTPINLVPACSHCNHLKREHAPTAADRQTFHPYFDDAETVQWLHAHVVEDLPAALVFEVRLNRTVPVGLATRVTFHFEKLKLAKLYTTHAAEELQNLRSGLEMLHAAGGPPAVRDRLIEQRDTYRANRLNSWQSAMYAALAASNWYCREGFRR